MKSPQRYSTAILSVHYLIVLHATRQPKGASTTMILLAFRGNKTDTNKKHAAIPFPAFKIQIYVSDAGLWYYTKH